MCGRLFEDGGHLFLNYKKVKQRWRALMLEEERVQLSQLTFVKEVIQAILSFSEEKKL